MVALVLESVHTKIGSGLFSSMKDEADNRSDLIDLFCSDVIDLIRSDQVRAAGVLQWFLQLESPHAGCRSLNLHQQLVMKDLNVILYFDSVCYS